jgi:hypothetical protein
MFNYRKRAIWNDVGIIGGNGKNKLIKSVCVSVCALCMGAPPKKVSLARKYILNSHWADSLARVVACVIRRTKIQEEYTLPWGRRCEFGIAAYCPFPA